MSLPIGTVTIATAGVAVQVVSSGHAVSAVSFVARNSNVGAIYIGDSSVSASSGCELNPGDELRLHFKETIDLRRFFADAANNNDKLDYAGVSA